MNVSPLPLPPYLFAPARPPTFLASAPAMPYAATTRTAPHYFCFPYSPDVSAKVSAIRACLCTLRIMHFNNVRGRIETWTVPC